MVACLDQMKAAENGWGGTKIRQSGSSAGNQSKSQIYGGEEGQTKEKESRKEKMLRRAIIFSLLSLAALGLLFVLVDVDDVIEKSNIIFRGGSCSACKDLDILEGAEYVKFERKNGENGCLELHIQCGHEKGTESILQWYKGEQDMGVSFMDQVGQSNVRRTLKCNGNGQYELEENGHRDVITAIECIVVVVHEEL